MQGGYARGKFDDINSDVDLILVFNKLEDGKNGIKGRCVINNKTFEFRHLYLDHVNPKQWEAKLRYIYSEETKVLKDTDNLLHDIINQAKMTKKEQLQIIIYAIRKLGIRGITYKGVYNDTWRGFYWDDPVDYWVIKGDLLSAHSRLNECYELICLLIFALNQ